jgi:hypothetical protein
MEPTKPPNLQWLNHAENDGSNRAGESSVVLKDIGSSKNIFLGTVVPNSDVATATL